MKKIASNKCYKKASGQNNLPKNWNAMQNKGFCVVRMTKQVFKKIINIKFKIQE